jgi:hypothetical protein
LKVVGGVDVQPFQGFVNDGELVGKIIVQEFFFELFECCYRYGLLFGEDHLIDVGHFPQNIGSRTFQLLHQVLLNFQVQTRTQCIIRIRVNIELGHDLVVGKRALAEGF